jgi:cadmium resistance protein CadD (predicted permease)
MNNKKNISFIISILGILFFIFFFDYIENKYIATGIGVVGLFWALRHLYLTYKDEQNEKKN